MRKKICTFASMNANEFYGFRLMPYTLHHVSFGKQIKKFNIVNK